MGVPGPIFVKRSFSSWLSMGVLQAFVGFFGLPDSLSYINIYVNRVGAPHGGAARPLRCLGAHAMILA